MNMIIVMEKTQLQDLLRAQTIQLLLLDYDENHIFFLFINRNIILPMYCYKNTPKKSIVFCDTTLALNCPRMARLCDFHCHFTMLQSHL